MTEFRTTADTSRVARAAFASFGLALGLALGLLAPLLILASVTVGLSPLLASELGIGLLVVLVLALVD